MESDDNNKFKLSIIIPVYNVEKYLSRCLNSILTQTYKNLEVILIDDGSTDNSMNICKDYVKKDARFKLYTKENGGACSARKAALKYITGNYVTCVDSDDWIESNAYSDLMESVKLYNPDVVACSFWKEFEKFKIVRNDYLEEGYYSKEKLHMVMDKVNKKRPLCWQVISGGLCNKIFKRNLFEKYQELVPNEIYIGEDMAVVLPMMFEIESLYICKIPYYHYCQNKKSSSWAWREGEFERLKVLVEYLRHYYYKYKDIVYQRFILNSIYFAMIAIMYDLPKTYFKKGIPFLKKINSNSRVIVYGKGVYAANLIEVIKKNRICNLIGNVDSNDVETLFDINKDNYDYVVIAILDSEIVDNIRGLLIENGIAENKILFIDQEDLTVSNLPYELWN